MAAVCDEQATGADEYRDAEDDAEHGRLRWQKCRGDDAGDAHDEQDAADETRPANLTQIGIGGVNTLPRSITSSVSSQLDCVKSRGPDESTKLPCLRSFTERIAFFSSRFLLGVWHAGRISSRCVIAPRRPDRPEYSSRKRLGGLLGDLARITPLRPESCGFVSSPSLLLLRSVIGSL